MALPPYLIPGSPWAYMAQQQAQLAAAQAQAAHAQMHAHFQAQAQAHTAQAQAIPRPQAGPPPVENVSLEKMQEKARRYALEVVEKGHLGVRTNVKEVKQWMG